MPEGTEDHVWVFFLEVSSSPSQPHPKASPTQAPLCRRGSEALWKCDLSSVTGLLPAPEVSLGLPGLGAKGWRVMCLRRTVEDPGFLHSGLGAASWQGGELGLVLKLRLHSKVTLNFHGLQSYSKGISVSPAPGQGGGQMAPSLGMDL